MSPGDGADGAQEEEFDFDEVRRVFYAARAVPTDERANFVERESSGPAMRDEVLSLLAMENAGSLDILEPGKLLAREYEERKPATSEVPQIQGFDVQRILGDGGMGRVYLAQQHAPHRPVALKVLRMRDTSDAMRARFAIEAESLARLSHPGIAQIYASGGFAPDSPGAGVPFIAMEYVRGHSLTTYAGSQSLSVNARIELFLKIVDAVHHAHTNGVIHRDLKPANILVGDDGFPKVLDFGIARLADSERARLTVERNEVLGTIEYMSPEQVLGTSSDVTSSSDVYSLGVVLFELLTGRLPHEFQDVSIATAAMRITQDTACKLREVVPTLHVDLELIVAKAIQQDPSMRYKSAANLADDLRRFLANEPILARKPSAYYQLRKFARRKRAVFVGSSIAILALVVGTALTLRYALRANAELTRADIAESKRLEAYVDNLLAAQADALPLLLKQDEHAPAVLLQKLDARAKLRPTSSLEALRIECARASLGEGSAEALLAAVPRAPAQEARNVELALHAVAAAARPDIAARVNTSVPDHARDEDGFRAHCRLALLAYSLGDEAPLRALLRVEDDASVRSATIAEAKRWSVAWEAIAKTLEDLPAIDQKDFDPQFISGLVACLGFVDPSRLETSLRARIEASLADCYQRCPNALVHSTLYWCMRRLAMPPPALPTFEGKDAPSEQEWFQHANGHSFVRIPAGASFLARGAAEFTHDLWMDDREVTVGQFRRYLQTVLSDKRDEERAADEPETGAAAIRKRLAELSKNDAHPVLTTWHEAIRYCNWRSVADGFDPVYDLEATRIDDKRAFLERRGYRLATTYELEYALRARTRTPWISGRTARHMLDQAQLSGSVGPAGTSLPNLFGAFDLAGNVWDVATDSIWGSLTSEPRDHLGPVYASKYCDGRGGPSDGGTYYAISTRRGNLQKTQLNGFRLVRRAPSTSLRCRLLRVPLLNASSRRDSELELEVRAGSKTPMKIELEWIAHDGSTLVENASALVTGEEARRITREIRRPKLSFDERIRKVPSKLLVYGTWQAAHGARRLCSVFSIRPVLAARKKSEDSTPSLRVVSWNLMSWTLQGDAREAQILRALYRSGADLVVLGSVDRWTRRSGVSMLPELARMLGLHVRWQRIRFFDGGDYGKLYLSRYPFRVTALHDKFLDRIEVEHPAGTVVVAHHRASATEGKIRPEELWPQLTRKTAASPDLLIRSETSVSVDDRFEHPTGEYSEIWAQHGEGDDKTMHADPKNARGGFVRRSEFAFLWKKSSWRATRAHVIPTPTGARALCVDLSLDR